MANAEKTWIPENLSKILDKHIKWVEDRDKGERADLSYADLSDFNDVFIDYADAPLKYINFAHANLEKLWLPDTMEMTHCNFQDADLSQTTLTNVDLRYSNFYRATIAQAYLQDAKLAVCNFKYANINSVVGNGHEIQSFSINGMSFVYTSDELQIGPIDRQSIDYWRNFVYDEIPGDKCNMHDDTDHWFRDWLRDKMPFVETFLRGMPAKKRWLPINHSDLDDLWKMIIKDIPIASGHHDMHEYRPPGKGDELNITLKKP